MNANATFAKMAGFHDHNMRYAIISYETGSIDPFLIGILQSNPDQIMRLYFNNQDSNGMMKVYNTKTKEFDYINIDDVGEMAIWVN